MSASNYLCYNGDFFKEEDLLFSAANRAFSYGDSIFETIRSNGTKLYFIDYHLRRLRNAANVLSFELDSQFEDLIKTRIALLIHKNKAFKSNRIRLTVFRNSGGLYSPKTNSVSFLIELNKIDDESYSLNRKGLTIGIYTEFPAMNTLISQFKTGNSLQYTLAGLYAKKKRLDDVVILSEDGFLSETISANIFIVKNNILYSPGVNHGCIDGILKEQVIKIASDLGITCYEDCDLRVNDLENADEIFITNSIIGIKWVVAYGNRRYFNKLSKLLSEELIKYSERAVS